MIPSMTILLIQAYVRHTQRADYHAAAELRSHG